MKGLSGGLVVFAFLLGTAGSAMASLGEYFVSTDWLAGNRNDIVVVDVRRTPLYLLGHIEGALHVDRDEFLQTRNGLKSLVPTTAEFEAMMSRLSITPATRVVAYAEDDNPYAARFVWTLRYHGHANAFVLDGGYQKWSQEGRRTALLPAPAPQPTSYRVAACRSIRAEEDYVLTRLGNPTVVVWDSRSGGEFEGTDVRADRGGHIPGAVHCNWIELQKEVNGVKVLRSEDEIRALLAAHGLTRDKEIIVHCQTGIRSSYAALVMLGLGYDQVRNYDGSWIEWANNPALPVEKTGDRFAGLKLTSAGR